MNIETVGVIGAGRMGSGIAQVIARSGIRVCLNDCSPQNLERAMEAIDRDLDRQISRGWCKSEDKAGILSRISPLPTLDGIGGTDLVIEAVTEDEAVKRSIFAEVCPRMREDAVLCTNTSSISITRLGATTDRPGRFMGMHFMNPVSRMELVELIRGIATDEDTFSTIHELVLRLGKVPVSAEDFPAFIVNRILLPMLNEAVYTLYEGVGSVDAIDTAMRLGAHHPLGPLQLADFIGLDVCLSVMQVLYEGLADSKYRPCPLLVKYVEAGWLGRKTRRGFYDYHGETPVPTR